MIYYFLAEIPIPEGPESTFWEAFFRMVISLGAVLVVLYAILWVLKRTVYGNIQSKDNKNLVQVVDFRPLSHKTTLYVLDIDGTRVLYAESHHGVHSTVLTPKKERPKPFNMDDTYPTREEG